MSQPQHRRIDSAQSLGDPHDSPTAWFAMLERARLIDNYEMASRAQSELKRLGVVVKFVRPQGLRKGGLDV